MLNQVCYKSLYTHAGLHGHDWPCFFYVVSPSLSLGLCPGADIKPGLALFLFVMYVSCINSLWTIAMAGEGQFIHWAQCFGQAEWNSLSSPSQPPSIHPFTRWEISVLLRLVMNSFVYLYLLTFVHWRGCVGQQGRTYVWVINNAC